MAVEYIGPDYVELQPLATPYVSGVLEYEGQPAPLRFMIQDRKSGELLASGKSNADGTYKRYLNQVYISERQVFVISFDDTGKYNAQVADLINAVP